MQEEKNQEMGNVNDSYSTTSSPSLLISFSILLAAVIISGSIIYATRNSTYAPSSVSSSTTSSNPAVSPTGTTQSQTADINVSGYPTRGSDNAPVTVVEFSDFECPFCKEAYTQYQQNNGPLTQAVGNSKVRYVFRNFPLTIHQNAHMEAEAGYCMLDQGQDKFWQLHDWIFNTTTSNGTGMTEDQMVSYVQSQGWDSNAFKSCIDSGKYKSKVDADTAEGSKYGIQGTPTFFVGGKPDSNGVVKGATMVQGAVPFTQIQSLISQYSNA